MRLLSHLAVAMLSAGASAHTVQTSGLITKTGKQRARAKSGAMNPQTKGKRHMSLKSRSRRR